MGIEDDEYDIIDNEDIEDIDREIRSKSVRRRDRGREKKKLPCPEDCPRFECLVGDNCKENCKELKFAKAQICDLCIHNDTCSSKLKIILLGGQYIQSFKENKVDDIICGAVQLKDEHRMLEREYRTITDELTKLNWYNLLQKPKMLNKKGKKRMEIIIARKYLSILKIKFEVGLNFDNK